MTSRANNTTPQARTVAWHILDSDQALEAANSSQDGLDPEEAARRLETEGANRLPPPQRRSALLRLALQFHNVLIYVLVAAGLVTATLGHWVDAGVIAGVVIINALIGYVQEGKAEKALDAIRNLLAQQATVRRGGRLMQVPAESLVPGDVVLLQSGDKVPADLHLFRTRDLRIDESLLTGESVPVDKHTDPVAEDAPLGDRRCIAFSGSLVTYGQGQGVVVATGARTEIGRISGMLSDVQNLSTPLLRQMAQFGRWLTAAILLVATATFAIGVLARGYTSADMFLAAVGLAVAAIPEGLPAIMTITLAIGVQQMARRNAIVRRLPAVETLGAVTVICSDKTGTLTRNEMTVRTVVCGGGVYEVSGEGYDPHGEIRADGVVLQVADHPALRELARGGLLCNDAHVDREGDEWRLTGDPTEGALVVLAMKAGLDHDFEQGETPRTDLIPFESEHKFMATLHHDHAGHGFIYVKGAPERILDMCTCQRMRGEDVPIDRAYWECEMERMAERGQRMLAVAFKTADADHRDLRFRDVEDGLTLLGVVGIIDPPRQEAIDAVAACRRAGIRVKMITGDHGATATSIARQMGIGAGGPASAGAELDALDDAALTQLAESTDVFARTSPEHKLRLVKSLQANGEVVAMTGDGVNDAPALKRADVGVAMGRKGTEAAKEAAEMVLADDNFASIANAVEEGRTVYDNLQKAIMFILPTNGGQAMTIIAAIVFGRMLPITPVQILWVNMVTAVTLALALAFEPPERDVMTRAPRNPREPILSRFLLWRIVFVSTILSLGTFALFIYYREQGASVELARTIAVNTLVLFEIFYLFSSRHLIDSAANIEGIVGNRYVLYTVGLLVILQLLFTYLPPMQHLFGTVNLGLADWRNVLVVATSVFVLVEIEKLILRRRLRRR
jgi:magnesium-transporting ATPase (P-type)